MSNSDFIKMSSFDGDDLLPEENKELQHLNKMRRIVAKGAVGFVWTVITSMVSVFYYCILTQLSGLQYLFHLCFGTWLIANTVFNYTMGWLTPPGSPTVMVNENRLSNVLFKVCVTCKLGKPPRSHHCSICGKCILKRDHHCPWLNNCIGFYNHRYFYLFCFFFVIDCFYLNYFGYQFYLKSVYPSEDSEDRFDSFFIKALRMFTLPQFYILFVFGFLISGLVGLHTYIISRGATNSDLKYIGFPLIGKKAMVGDYEYDCGIVKNWKLFLAVDDFKSFARQVLLPSYYRPAGNGIEWDLYKRATHVV